VKQLQQSAKTFLPKAILALGIIGLYFFLSESPWAKEHLKSNFERNIVAKDFTLPLIGAEPGDAGQFSLAEFKGSPTVVSFWASWCSVCRGETPQLIELNKEMKERGLNPIVNIASYDNLADIRNTERFKAGEFRNVIDKDGSVAQLWKVKGLPHTFVLDKDGNVIMSVSGALSEAKLAELRTLL
jgi:thiol-disulfide isomerase/thioredoxin